MTTEKHHEGDPNKHETYSSDEVFNVITETLQGFEVVKGELVLSVGRRSGENSAKGFSTDPSTGTIYCPGVNNQQNRDLESIVLLVSGSVLTCIRHTLNPQLGQAKKHKSEEYKQKQTALSLELIKLSQCFGSDDELVGMINRLMEQYSAFMTTDTDIDPALLEESFYGITELLFQLRKSFVTS